MIQYIFTEGHRYTLADIQRDPHAPEIKYLTYDALFRTRRLPRATYLFTDMDRLALADLELAARLYRELKSLGVRVLNDPARVKLRYPLLRALFRAGLNDYNAYRAEELPVEMRFPVYFRRVQGHAEPVSELLHDPVQVQAALETVLASGVPLENLMVIEYAGEPVRPGLYRKLSAFRMGDAMVPFTGAHDKQWLVKRGITGIAGDELYQEELSIVRDELHCEQLRTAFERGAIDFGRVDYGFLKGRLQIYEINTNPHIPAPKPHPNTIRTESTRIAHAKVLAGLHGIDSPAGAPIFLSKDRLFRPHRRWNRYFFRTRLVK